MEQAHARADVEAHREWAAQKSICETEIADLLVRLPAAAAAAAAAADVAEDGASPPAVLGVTLQEEGVDSLLAPGDGFVGARSGASPSPARDKTIDPATPARAADAGGPHMPLSEVVLGGLELEEMEGRAAVDRVAGSGRVGREAEEEARRRAEEEEEEERRKAEEEEEIAMEMRRAMFVAEAKRLQLERERGLLKEGGREEA